MKVAFSRTRVWKLLGVVLMMPLIGVMLAEIEWAPPAQIIVGLLAMLIVVLFVSGFCVFIEPTLFMPSKHRPTYTPLKQLKKALTKEQAEGYHSDYSYEVRPLILDVEVDTDNEV